MSGIASAWHFGERPVIVQAFRGLRTRGYIVFADASAPGLFWVNGHALTAGQTIAFALARGVRIKT